MARYGKSGMLAAGGLISGVAIFLVYPHLKRTFRRLSEWLIEKSLKPLKNNFDEKTTAIVSYPPPITSTETSTNSEDTDNESGTELENNICNNKEIQNSEISNQSSFPGNLHEKGLQVIKELEQFNIFTETVAYKIKSERDLSDKTVYCKNLFLKDRKGTFYYFICREDNNVNLRQLKYKLHAHRNFSFASPQEVLEQLNVAPGCITPFAFLTGSVSEEIKIAISRDLLFEKNLNFHPLHEDFATRISFGLLLKLFGHLKRKLHILDL